MDKSVIIIGSGLGGLECGYILAKHGFKVTVLEKDKHIGGCLQTFRRRGSADPETGLAREYTFDTGLHYVGGLGEGNSLDILFKYFNLLDLPWHNLDADCFDEVDFVGDSLEAYPFANGHSSFVEALSSMFPQDRDGLRRYADFLRNVGDNVFKPFHPSDSHSGDINDLFAKSAFSFVQGSVRSPLLRKVLAGTSLKMELQEESLPLYVFAQINNSFIQSASRLVGGGSLIAERLASGIVAMGGEIRTKTKVTTLNASEGMVTSVSAGDETFCADWVISDAHPAVTIGLIGENSGVRKIYKHRIQGLANTYGMFTANICLKPGALPYLNRNLYVHRSDADLWHPDSSRTESVLVHFYVPENGRFATHLDLISPMDWDELAPWADLPHGHRGEAYEALKMRKALECVELASARLPGLKAAVDKIWTSSPLTYHSYTSSSFGSAYGIRKDWRNPMATVMSPRTPLANLLMTGQSLNLHGVLGVSMTSVLTCAGVLGLEAVCSDIFVK